MSEQATLEFDNRPEDDADTLALGDYARRAYLDYAISVVKGRALPDVCDGLKPVQRRILYAMWRMGLTAEAKPVKSARVVGDVLGRFHPHGDQAAYDALVRLSQDFAQRYPLIDGQGNFGSRDGDGAAAMRYTEARLASIARLLLGEIDAGATDFIPNYDGSTTEPRLLPARLPFVLLNGASGIAVGMATEIPSHNLHEVASVCVALLKNPRLELTDALALMPGPDFATGGQIISSPQDIAAAYASGRGSLKVRARWTIEELARGQWQLVIHELPHGTSTQQVLEEIEELSNPKVRPGRKALAPEQIALKTSLLGLLDTVRDESGREAAVRLVFEPRSSRIDVAEFVNTLLARTSLETSVPINLVMIGADGKPRQKGLMDILREWLAYRGQTVQRRTRHRLEQVDARIHILQGRQQVLLNLDEVIDTIRNSDDPKPALMTRFDLTELQADDILDMRLRQLARLEAIRIDKELAAQRAEAADLHKLLADDKAMTRRIISEIEADAKQFGDERRTLIQFDERAVAEVKVVDEAVTVIVSRKGWLRTQKGHGLMQGALAFKPGDALYATFECRSVDPLVVFGSDGRAYSIDVADLPGGRGDGQPVTTFIELAPGTQALHYVAGERTTAMLLWTAQGFGFVARLGDGLSRQRAGKTFITLEDGDALQRPLRLDTDAAGRPLGRLAVLSADGRLLLYPAAEVKTLARGGRGITLMALDAQETLQSVAQLATERDALLVSGKGRGGLLRSTTLGAAQQAPYVGKRARRGRKIEVTFKPEWIGRA
ncbi:MAG: DNA topoisomerase IV subunit A [Thiomonas sp.]|uniref:DNA topoisomerase IV subunit A n=1 Tax=Thiomonas sp. TaxID=2047785 RepID=UPI002A3697C6|nr:DNA topoisomerase IV subunit A [Thiomonas sp.]MDY0331104.1 DNA topoisomerase IV subunit A [Thiomonas sp.]